MRYISYLNGKCCNKQGNELSTEPYRHAYVDLGLPSGTLWATMNVGASSETDYGLYFQWGDTKGYTADQVGPDSGQKAFTRADYKWTGNDDVLFTKYDLLGGKTDLDLEDDAARANWGGGWHMPTLSQVEELVYNTNQERTTVNNVNGYKFISKTDSSKYIFIPGAGYAEEEGMRYVGDQFRVSSNAIHYEDPEGIYGLVEYGYDFTPDVGYASRYLGCSVRGVLDASSHSDFLLKKGLTTEAEIVKYIEDWHAAGEDKVTQLLTQEYHLGNIPAQMYEQALQQVAIPDEYFSNGKLLYTEIDDESVEYDGVRIILSDLSTIWYNISNGIIAYEQYQEPES